jgi:hypothetical protein
MPTSRMVTTCMPLTMRKKPQSITPKSTVPSKNSYRERMFKAALDAAFTF